jgi:hypothetical protein
MGEVSGRAPPGFDFGNSPFEVSKVDFQGKTIIQRTSAGTQGIVVAAHRAERLYASSLLEVEARCENLCSLAGEKHRGCPAVAPPRAASIPLRNRGYFLLAPIAHVFLP